MVVQVIRRTAQAVVVLLIAALAWLSLYAHYRAARIVDDEVLMSTMRGKVIAQAIHPHIDALQNPQQFLDQNKGTLWSMRLLGVDLSDPLAGAEAIAASRSVHWPLIISVIIPIIATILLGKVFCSWICPGYLLFELCGKLRRVLHLAEIRPLEVTFSHGNKYVFLLVGLTLAVLSGAPLFVLIYPPAVISRTIHAWIFGTELAAMLLILGMIVTFELFVSPRWWCRTMCPGGALYGLLGWKRLIRVKLARADCTGCQACIPVCEAGINPIAQSASLECDNCGACINHCEPGALYYDVSLPKGTRSAVRRQLPKKSLLIAVSLLPYMCVHSAFGHHVLGLPHYSYKENYPQRPTLEYPATTGPYDVLLTSYPGNPVPGEPANLAFYIKNRLTREVYVRPVKVRVLQTSTFGDNTVIMPEAEHYPFDNQHKLQCTFPVDAEYVIELAMVVEGRTELIPFLMVAGEPTATASIVVMMSCAAIFLFVVIRAIQIKRRRRSKLRLVGME